MHVRYGEFFTFLGPPKSGKSDVLRAVAGFLPITRGRVLVDSQDISAVPPRLRGVGYVFRTARSGRTCARGITSRTAFASRACRRTRSMRRVEMVLGRLELADAAALKPGELSLEQRRRLALARALAIEPRVLLLDEPLANLDPTARKALRLELTKLHRDLAVTTIHATRNAADALALSDRLAVIDGGRVLQVGDPAELYHQPQTRAAGRGARARELLAGARGRGPRSRGRRRDRARRPRARRRPWRLSSR